VLSYHLQWDNHTNGTTWSDLVGASPDSTALTYTKSAGVAAATTYQFRVRARNVHGWGAYSDAVSIGATGVPHQMAAVVTSIDAATGGVKIAWTAAGTGGLAVDAYLIEIQNGASSTWTVDATNCNGGTAPIPANRYCIVPVSVLTASPYSYAFDALVTARVSAHNAKGHGPVSPTNTATTGAKVRRVPSAPAVPTVTASSDAAITVAWAALVAPADGNSAVTAYNLYWDNGTGTTSVSLFQGLATSYSVSGLTGGNTYKFKVRALNVYGAGAYSTELSETAIDVPSQVAVPTVTLPNATSTDVRVTWVAPNAHSSTIDKYEILFRKADATYVAIAANCNGALAATVTAKQCDVPMATIITATGFARGTLVQAKVAAHNARGWGAHSEINTAGALVAVAPAAPALPTSGAGTTTTAVQVAWAALTTGAQTGGSAITSYNLDWDQGTGTWAEVVGAASAYTAVTHTKTTGFTAGSTYKFRVRAQNAHGWGPYSPTLTVVPAAAPATMAAVAITVDNVYAKIAWAQPTTNGAAITAYKIVIQQLTTTAYSETTTYCDGSDGTILAQKYCLVPMSALTAAPYSLPLGRLVVAQAQA
jgi:hypothetical protein